MNSINIGTKVQRKGSSIIWTVEGRDTLVLSYDFDTHKSVLKDRGIENTKQVNLSCLPKNRESRMYKWIDLETYHKNWKEV